MTEKVKGKWVLVETKKYQCNWWLKSDVAIGVYEDHCKYITESQLQDFMNDMSNNEDILELKIYKVMDIDFEESK